MFEYLQQNEETQLALFAEETQLSLWEHSADDARAYVETGSADDDNR